jgi:hypothetical protein
MGCARATEGVQKRKQGPYKRGGTRGWKHAGASLAGRVPTTDALPFNYQRCGVLGALCAALSANAPLAARATCELGPRSAVQGRSWTVPSAADEAVGISLKVVAPLCP